MLIYPLDTISINVKSNTAKFMSFREGFLQIVERGGAKGLVRGIPSTFPGAFIPGLIYFSAYEYLNNFWKKVIGRCES